MPKTDTLTQALQLAKSSPEVAQTLRQLIQRSRPPLTPTGQVTEVALSSSHVALHALEWEAVMAVVTPLPTDRLPSTEMQHFLHTIAPLLQTYANDMRTLQSLLADVPQASSNPVSATVATASLQLEDVVADYEALKAFLEAPVEATDNNSTRRRARRPLQMEQAQDLWQSFVTGLKETRRLLARVKGTQDNQVLDTSLNILGRLEALIEPLLDTDKELMEARESLAELLKAQQDNDAIKPQSEEAARAKQAKRIELQGTIATQEANIKELLESQAAGRTSFDDTLTQIQQGMRLFSSVLKSQGNEELGEALEQVTTISTGALQSLSTLVAAPRLAEAEAFETGVQPTNTDWLKTLFNTVKSGGAALAPIGASFAPATPIVVPAVALGVAAVGGCALFSWLQGRQTRNHMTKLVIRQSQYLAKTMQRVGQHLDKRFDRMESLLKVGLEYTAQRFDRVEGLMSAGFHHVDQRLTQLQNVFVQGMEHTDQRFDRVERFLKAYHDYTDQRFNRLEQLHEAQFHYTAQRFDVVTELLQGVNTHMIVRFEHVTQLMVASHREAFTQFARLHESLDAIRHSVTALGHQIRRLDSRMDQRFREAFLQDYTRTRDKAFRLRQSLPPTQLVTHLNKKATLTYLEPFRALACTQASSATLAGSPTDSLTALAAEVREQAHPEHCLLSLAHYAGWQSRVVNPLVWAEGARSYLEFLYQYPEFVPPKSLVDALGDIKAQGQNVLTCLATLKTNTTFLGNLLQQYQRAFMRLVNLARAQLMEHTTPSEFNEEVTLTVPATIAQLRQSGARIPWIALWERHQLEVQCILLNRYQAQSQTTLTEMQSVLSTVTTQLDQDVDSAHTALQQLELSRRTLQSAASNTDVITQLYAEAPEHLTGIQAQLQAAPEWQRFTQALEDCRTLIEAYASLLFRPAWQSGPLQSLLKEGLWSQERLTEALQAPQPLCQTLAQSHVVHFRNLETWLFKQSGLAKDVYARHPNQPAKVASYLLVVETLKELTRCQRWVQEGLLAQAIVTTEMSIGEESLPAREEGSNTTASPTASIEETNEYDFDGYGY